MQLRMKSPLCVRLTATATFEIIGHWPDRMSRFILRSLLAGVHRNLVKSPEPLGTAWRISVPGRNPADEDVLMQVNPIRNV
jgi:hypothetical protein